MVRARVEQCRSQVSTLLKGNLMKLRVPLIALLLLVAGQVLAAERKPNIVLIYSDDHGWSDLAIHGADPHVRTPHLDQLARDGVLFKRGYVTAPQCVPSRAAVITGRYQQRFGVEDNNQGPLPLGELTIAERLKPAGYVSGWVGKCHLDISGSKVESKGAGKAARLLTDHMPHRQGFDEYFRGELKQFYASHDLQGRAFEDAPHLVTDNRFRVNVQTEAALSFLDRRAARPEQPFFLYLAWYAPHVPLESPEPWFSQTPAELPLKRRQALAMIAAMDDGLGRLRAKLKEIEQEQNTLIFFIGDNGAPLGDAWNGSLNVPMIGQKGMVAEGGVRVPFVAAWPGKIPSGQVFEHPVISLDVAATAVALSGQPHDAKLDGVNLMPFVTGANTQPPHEHLFWRWGSQAAVQEMPHKLIQLGDRPPLLFDIRQPDGENIARNLAAKHPDVVARLERKLKEWAATLQPPGLITDASAFSRRHEGLFTEHHILAGETAPEPAPAATLKPATNHDLQGWIARNGTLKVKDGALVLTPDVDLPKNARPFITNSSLDLVGPVTITLRIRARSAGKGAATVTWRTKQESFADHQSASFDWPVGSESREVKATLSEKAHIPHVRITPPRDAERIEVESIEFKDSRNETRSFRFAASAQENSR